MTRPITLALFVFSALLRAPAQPSASTPTTSSIAGSVVKEPGSQPLKKVLVQIVAENQKDGSNYSASTDADGHFRVENVAPGRYRVFIEKAGFVGVNERGLKLDTTVFTARAGQSLDDLLFRMLPTAILNGRVTDEDGDPMAGVRILVLKKVPGKAKREPAGTEATNDLGEYRLAGLFPGEYWVVAMPPADFRDYEPQHEKSLLDGKSGDQPDNRYVPTYYPGSYDAARASPLTLKAGDEMPANFTLVPARTYRVSGIVAGLAPGLKAVVELLPKAGDSIHASEVGSDGSFEVRGVAPGSYVMSASAGVDSKTLTAHQDVNVVAADVDGVRLSPIPSFRLTGRLQIEGGAAADVTQYSVNLRAAAVPQDPGFFESRETFGMNASVDRLGNFEWKDVSPGNYIVQLYGRNVPDSFTKSVRLGGRDVERGFTASGSLAIDIVVSAKGGSIDGIVADKEAEKESAKEKDGDQTHPVTNATVVAVPEEKYRLLPDHFGAGSTDQQGYFTIRGLAPGNYTLFAWRDIEDGIWNDADFLHSQEANGTVIKVEENSHQRLDLKLSPTGDDWR
jgi:protocatechuate 3,4-dioxygenase beta subunit